MHYGGFSICVYLTLSCSLPNVSSLKVNVLCYHVKNTHISLVILLHNIVLPLKPSLVALCLSSCTLLRRKSIVVK